MSADPSENTTPEVRAAPTNDLAPGAQLAKYRLRRIVGSGGMGVVWAAHDPDLDREVAVKLLHGAKADPAARTRLLREARAMARLKHPNVVTVYEVGSEGSRDYVVMELVDGDSLDRWLGTRPPTPEVFAAILASGRGLAAAHAADLVHRDFKPHNVLRGSDGRVLVTDFGLARERRDIGGDLVDSRPSHVDALEETAAPASAVDSVLGSPLTGTGLLIGTPAYMSPEQLGGASSDASTDQYAFCVTAWQALAGQRPFRGDTLDELHTAALAGPARVKATIAPAIRAVLERGLDPDPAKRWPDMEGLLRALVRAHRRRTIVALSVAASIALIAAGVGVYGLVSREGDACTGAGDELRTAWNDQTRATARDAFLATRVPYAALAWQHAEAALDDYGRDWSAMHTETCKATLHKEQTAEAMDVRMSCLGQRLQGVRAAAELFAHADPQIVAKAADIAGGLAPLSPCSDLASLKRRIQPPANPAIAAEVDVVHARLANVAALANGGKTTEAVRIAEAALADARAAGYAPLIAEALVQLGELQLKLRQDERARQTLGDAFIAAEGCSHDVVAIRAANALSEVVGVNLSREADGMWWIRIARAVLARAGGDALTKATIARAAGMLLIAHARYDEALVELRPAVAIGSPRNQASSHILIAHALDGQAKFADGTAELHHALAIFEQTDGADSPSVAGVHRSLGQFAIGTGDYVNARAELERALAIYSKNEVHAIDLAYVREMMGIVAYRQGKLAEALAMYQAAFALREHALGLDHPDLADSYLNIGSALEQLGRYDEALDQYHRALALQERADVPQFAAGTHNNIAIVLMDQGKYDAALAEHRLALALREKTLGKDHPEVAATHFNIGIVLLTQKKFHEAQPELEHALAIQNKTLGPAHPDTAATIGSLGKVALGLHDYPRAIEQLGRAVATLEAANGDPIDLAEYRFALAKALWGSPGDRTRPRELVKQARETYATTPAHEQDVREIDTWLLHP